MFLCTQEVSFLGDCHEQPIRRQNAKMKKKISHYIRYVIRYIIISEAVIQSRRSIFGSYYTHYTSITYYESC